MEKMSFRELDEHYTDMSLSEGFTADLAMYKMLLSRGTKPITVVVTGQSVRAAKKFQSVKSTRTFINIYRELESIVLSLTYSCMSIS